MYMLIVEHIEGQAGDEEGESLDYANSQATMQEPSLTSQQTLLLNKYVHTVINFFHYLYILLLFVAFYFYIWLQLQSMVVIVGRRRGNQSTGGRGRIAVNGRGGNTATKGRGTTVVARGRGNTAGRGGRGNTAPRGGRENTAPRERGGRTPTLPSVMIRERGPNTNDNGGRQIAVTNRKGKGPMVGNGKQPN